MIIKKNVSGYEAFQSAMQELKTTASQINIYFSGEKDESGKSWCPDCNAAEPHVMKALNEYALQNSVILIVDVGNRNFWKDLENPFRTDKNFQVSVIPTLLRWNYKWRNPVRLEGDQCAEMSLLEMFFKEKDEM